MIILYGIKQCDTVKKARKWLEKNHISFKFHDFRIDGIEKSLIHQWIDDIGHEALINKRSTTWRSLTKEEQNDLVNDDAVRLIISYPTLIKRPILDTGNNIFVGFSESYYQESLLPQPV